jgi:8-oxo-dGTP diphosphatase
VTAATGKNPARAKPVQVERIACAPIPDGRFTVEGMLAGGKGLNLDMSRDELAALYAQIGQAIGDDTAARLAKAEQELKAAQGAVDRARAAEHRARIAEATRDGAVAEAERLRVTTGGGLLAAATAAVERWWSQTGQVQASPLVHGAMRALRAALPFAPSPAEPPPRRRVVSAVVVGLDGTVLLAQRDARSDYADHWECPGGKVEEGETDHDALRRELLEELGTRAVIREMVGEVDFDPPAVTWPRRVILYRVDLLDEPAPLASRRLRWWPPDEMDGLLLMPANRALLAEVKRAAQSPGAETREQAIEACARAGLEAIRQHFPDAVFEDNRDNWIGGATSALAGTYDVGISGQRWDFRAGVLAEARHHPVLADAPGVTAASARDSAGSSAATSTGRSDP